MAIFRFHVWIALFGLLGCVFGSAITIFEDGECALSWAALDTTNGFPDGPCRSLNVTAGHSFQIQKLDPGCGVTLYGPNEDSLVCSSKRKKVGEVATCYGDEWVYYSIDNCLRTTPNATVLPKARTGSSMPVPHKIEVSVVVGAVAAVLVCFVLVSVGVLLFFRRKHNKKPPRSPRHELSNDRELAESAAMEKQEMWVDPPAVEIGRNSRFEESRPKQPGGPHVDRVQIWWVS